SCESSLPISLICEYISLPLHLDPVARFCIIISRSRPLFLQSRPSHDLAPLHSVRSCPLTRNLYQQNAFQGGYHHLTGHSMTRPMTHEHCSLDRCYFPRCSRHFFYSSHYHCYSHYCLNRHYSHY